MLAKQGVSILVLALALGSLAACSSDSDCAVGEDVTVTEGLTYREIECGEGDPVASGDTIRVHYTGTFENGEEFDSSSGGDPFELTLGTGFVIEGWEEGIPGMKEGGIRELTIGPDLAYGPDDYQGIPGGSTLNFEIELVEVVSQGS
jgi:FKBP-type peptidyl-prolyl cis-trans isomerase